MATTECFRFLWMWPGLLAFLGVFQGAAMAIELQVDAAPSHFLSGAFMPVTVTLHNTENKPIDAPIEFGAHVFGYRLQALDTTATSYSLSAMTANAHRMDDSMPRRQVPLSPLAAGARRSYTTDIASLSVGSLAPGRYQLSAVYATSTGLVVSPVVVVQIVAPRLLAVSGVSSGQGARLAQVMIDASSQSQLSILQRESRDQHPADGNFFVRHMLDAKEPLQGVAVAAEGAPANGVRWFAWLLNTPAGASLGAGVAQSDTVFKHINPVPLHAAKGVLSSTGWQPNQESASFVVLATSADEQLQLVLVTFAATGQVEVRSVGLGSMALPSRWLVRFHGDTAPQKLDFVSVERQNGRTRILHRSIDFGAGRATAPVVLGDSSAELLALALEPVRGLGADVVDVLFASATLMPKMVFQRLPLAGGKPLEEFAFDLHEESAALVSTDWQLSPPAHSQRVAVAHLGGQWVGFQLASGKPMTGKSFVLQGPDQRASLMQLHAIGDALWASWVDSGTGLRFRAIP